MKKYRLTLGAAALLVAGFVAGDRYESRETARVTSALSADISALETKLDDCSGKLDGFRVNYSANVHGSTYWLRSDGSFMRSNIAGDRETSPITYAEARVMAEK